MKKILIATIDGMINKEDIKELEKIGTVDWLVKDCISDVELANIAKEYDAVIFAEDGVKEGGISLSAGDYLLKNSYNNFEICAFPQKFLAQGSRTQILEDCKMDSRSLAEKAMALLYKK